jgi:hypothetical protein
MATLKAKEVEAKLKEQHGNMAGVARCFGVTRQAVWYYIQKRPGLLEVLFDCREGMKDHAESVLYRAILEGDVGAAKWYLKTQARDRGYGERMEHSQYTDDEIEARINAREEQIRQEARREAMSGSAGVSG